MKKIKDFLLSLILPSKMYKHHNMRFIYSLGIFILSTLIILFSVNLSMRKFTEKTIPTAKFNPSDYNGGTLTFPEYQIVELPTGEVIFDCTAVSTEGKVDEYRGNFHEVIEKKDGSRKIDLTIVYVEDLDAMVQTDEERSAEAEKLKTTFDLNGYMNQQYSQDIDYFLYIFTKKSCYYCYNLGKTTNKSGVVVENSKVLQVTSFEYDMTKGDANYYLPASESELVKNSYGDYETTKWTRLVNSDETIVINDETFKATKRFSSNIRQVFFKSEYSYGRLDYQSINEKSDAINFGTNTNTLKVVNAMYEMFVDYDTTFNKAISSFFVLVANLIVPFLWVLITWLMSRHFVMSKFKEYYAICSITYLTTSIVGFILGFFISYTTLILIMLIVELVYYIVVTFRINSNSKLIEEVEEISGNKPQQPGIQRKKMNFTKIESDDTYRIE